MMTHGNIGSWFFFLALLSCPVPRIDVMIGFTNLITLFKKVCHISIIPEISFHDKHREK